MEGLLGLAEPCLLGLELRISHVQSKSLPLSQSHPGLLQFLFLILFGALAGGVQNFLLALDAGITPGSTEGPYVMPRIQPELAVARQVPYPLYKCSSPLPVLLLYHD